MEQEKMHQKSEGYVEKRPDKTTFFVWVKQEISKKLAKNEISFLKTYFVAVK